MAVAALIELRKRQNTFAKRVPSKLSSKTASRLEQPTSQQTPASTWLVGATF